MLSLSEAQARALALAPKTAEAALPVLEAQGHYLAEDLVAARTQPPADLSAMDGYAIAGEGPWNLAGESRAGTPFARALSAGEAVRISTGAHMPQGSDRVLIQENAEVADRTVSCTCNMPEAGKHVRQRGFDFAKGDRVLTAGTRIGPAQIAVALSAGHDCLTVHRLPRVAVLDSGDELSSSAANCRPDQIPASNGVMLAAMLSTLGCEVSRIGPVADDLSALADALAETEEVDILVTSGGASVGDHDLIRPALENWGAVIDFWKVGMKPGKPLMVARRGGQTIIGLPGNPVSSFVTAFLFLLPLVRAAMGAADPLPRMVSLTAGTKIGAGGSRQEFLRAHWDGQAVKPVDSQDSSALAALAISNSLIIRPVEAAAVALGETVECYLLENG